MTVTDIGRLCSMRVFVTGASGWVGSAVLPELLSAGHEVLGLARSESAAAAVRGAGAQGLVGSLEDREVLRSGAADCDGVIHLGFVHDFANYEAANRLDRDAIAAMGAA